MNKKEKREQGIDKKTIGLQKYRRMTLNLIVILLFLSIWTTMINNIDWKFSDIAMEMISLIIIAIVGMFSKNFADCSTVISSTSLIVASLYLISSASRL